jgi:hypothetical protein
MKAVSFVYFMITPTQGVSTKGSGSRKLESGLCTVNKAGKIFIKKTSFSQKEVL